MEDRRRFLGGSDVAAMFGVHPWKTALELWEEKTAAEVIEPEIEPEREKLFRRGKKLEPWVMEMLEEERGIFIQKRNQRYCDPEFPYFACEIDFEYVDDSGCICNGDVKTVSPFAASDWGDQGTDEIPIHYCLQFLWGQMITARQLTLVAVLIGADDLRVYEVKRDEELIAEIRRRAVEFWEENIIKLIPPPPQSQRDTHKLLAKHGGFMSAGNPEVWESIRRLRGVRAAVKRLKDIQDKYEFAVKKNLVIEAEALGLTDEPPKFTILGPDGKKLAAFNKQFRAGYTVNPCEFWVLRT